MSELLKLNQIETHIGQYHILQGVSFEVKKGEVTVCWQKWCRENHNITDDYGSKSSHRKEVIVFKGEQIQSLPTYTIAKRELGMFQKIKVFLQA